MYNLIYETIDFYNILKMKIDIGEDNLIIKNVMANNIVNKVKILKTVDEFSSYRYFLNADDEKVIFAFGCLDFDIIYDFSGKEWIDKEFSGNH